MRRNYTTFVWILVGLWIGVSTGLFAQKSYKDLKYPRLHEIKVPKVEQVTLKNGMHLFLLEDHELPLIYASARIRVGSIYDPPDKVGLASITGTVMRTGGTEKLTGDQIDDLLESIAASVETDIGLDAGTAYMSSLKEDFDKAFGVFADVLMHPAFRKDKLELAKIQEKSMIARRNDDVGQIAFREFRKLIYGPKSVYARQPEYETIDRITRKDLVAFHKKYFHPNNVWLAVWGDFNKKEMIRKVEQAFQSWEPAKIDFPKIPEVKYTFRQTVNLVRKPDVNQTNILMGHIGGTLDDPDYYALVIMNRILGSGFTSRLFRNVRSRMGLAYSVFGNYSANFDYPGIFFVGCQTKSQTTVKAIRAMLAEVKRITESEVTDEELQLAKESYLNSYVFNFDTKEKVIRRILTYAYYGYPLDFLQRVKKNVEKVTKADILRAARTHLHPDALQILAVGNDKDFDEPLSVLGPVHEIDITIPVPKEKLPEASKASLKKGKAIMEKVLVACGGREALRKIQNVQMVATMTISAPQGSMDMQSTTLLVYPDRLLSVVKTPMGEIRQILNRDQAWMVSPQGSMDMPASQREEMKKEMYRGYVSLLRLVALEGIAPQFAGTEKIDGQKVIALVFSGDKTGTLRLYVNPETYLPVAESYQGTTRQGPAKIESRYSDFKAINGVQIPTHIVSFANGKKTVEITLKDVRFNVPVNDKDFQRKK